MRILDLSAGNRAIWFDKRNVLTTFIDIRPEVKPDYVMDSRELCMRFPSDTFDIIVWDPPHCNTGKNSRMSKAYGHHTTAEILDLIEKTSEQAWHVARHQGGLMAFKWGTHDIKLDRVLKLMPQWDPLFGHKTRDGGTSRSQTYWVMLRRRSEW